MIFFMYHWKDKTQKHYWKDYIIYYSLLILMLVFSYFCLSGYYRYTLLFRNFLSTKQNLWCEIMRSILHLWTLKHFVLIVSLRRPQTSLQYEMLLQPSCWNQKIITWLSIILGMKYYHCYVTFTINNTKTLLKNVDPIICVTVNNIWMKKHKLKNLRNGPAQYQKFCVIISCYKLFCEVNI